MSVSGRHGLVVAKYRRCPGSWLSRDDQTRQIRIDIEGPADAKRDLLAVIRKEFRRHLPRVQPQDRSSTRSESPAIASQCRSARSRKEEEPHYFDWRTVQRYAKKKLKKIRCDLSLDEVSVQKLMGQVAVGQDTWSEFAGREANDIVEDSMVAGSLASTKASSVKKPSVFLSYCHDDDMQVTRVHAALQARNIEVWWDKDILPGKDWKVAIRQAMKKSDMVVLCLSAKSMKRQETGIYPEALDAIAAYRKRPPGTIYLIPVRLSKCEVPDIEIDDTRTLDRLQHVDLFPKSAWDANINALIMAIRTTVSE